MKRHFKTEDGRVIELETPEPRDGQSIFVVAGHKTGSVLLTNLVRELTDAAGAPAIPVEASVWKDGFSVPDWPQSLYDFMESDGYIYYSFRWLQELPKLKTFKSRKKLFMIRDPRDIAVSYYFSMSRSHSLPQSGKSRDSILALRESAGAMGIDEFIQEDKAGGVLRNIQRFADYQNDPTAVFYRYEDVIFDKRNWVKKIASDINVSVPEEKMNAIADKHDVRPTKEAPDKHIRSVTPGGWREKLAPESVAYIEQKYPVFFNKYGYE